MRIAELNGLLCLNDIHRFISPLLPHDKVLDTTPDKWLETNEGIEAIKTYKASIKIESWAVYAPFRVALIYSAFLGRVKKKASSKNWPNFHFCQK